MAVKCDEHCGECQNETCLSYQINKRLTAEIKMNNHGNNNGVDAEWTQL